MPDMRASTRPALAGKKPLNGDGVSMRALPEGYVVHLLGGWDAELSPLLNELSAERRSVRRAAPGQWFLVGDEPLSRAEFHALEQRLAPHASCVDQSHGRVRILVSGPRVERALSAFTGADLALAVFPVGTSTTSLFGHIAAHVTRVSDTAFELMLLRGFAESLWEYFAGTWRVDSLPPAWPAKRSGAER